MSKDKEPDNVTHSQESAIPFASTGIGPTIHKTEIKDGAKTYTGTDWTEQGANEKAGDKYNRGDADK